jgi:hypothetical protein
VHLSCVSVGSQPSSSPYLMFLIPL